MEKKRAILNNPLYAEILYKIADREVYPTGFVEEFRNPPDRWEKKSMFGSSIAKGFDEPGDDDENNFGFEWDGEKYRKNIPTIYRQLMKLHKEGYLLISEEQKKGKKHLKNKKFFSINWEKIVEVFVERVIFIQEQRLNNEKEPWEHLTEMLKEMKEPSYMEKAVKNKILQNFFKELFTEIRQALYYHRTLKKERTDIVLNELFELIIEYDLMEEFKKNLENELKSEDDVSLPDALDKLDQVLRKKYPNNLYYPAPDKKTAHENVRKADKERNQFIKDFIGNTIGKKYVDDYFFLERFCVYASGIFSDDKKFIMEAVKESVVHNVLYNLNEEYASHH